MRDVDEPSDNVDVNAGFKLGQPPLDPLAGMTSAERRHAQERATLEMAYDLDRFFEVVPRERPDFALRSAAADAPFGVEVTQLFPTESDARLNLVHGYAHHLWSGGEHMHKDDVRELQSVKVTITSEDGTVRKGVPAIIGPSPTLATFRSALARAIDEKSRASYDLADFSHCNLVILDWFSLSFDPRQYTTDRFFDEDVRAALEEAPFREVLLIVSASSDSDGDAPMPFRIVPLQQLLAMERMYVTGRMVAQVVDEAIAKVAEVNAFAIDHLVRVQGFGEAVMLDGRPFLRYRDILLEWAESGMQVREPAEVVYSNRPKANLMAQLAPEAESEVSARVCENVFGCGYTRPANRPTSWVQDTVAKRAEGGAGA
jgi:hypothetical protein